MQVTLALREKAAQLLAADAASLAPVALANHVFLVMAAFVASEASVIGDLTLATFDGSAALSAGVGTQAEGLDPNNTNALITIKSPVGGWRWETTGVTNLPQTIFGYCMLDNADAVLLGCQTLDQTITLTAINQVVDLGSITITQQAGSMT